MKTAYPEIVVRAVALIVFLLFVIGVTAADDDTLARIANYRQWTKVSQDLDIRDALSSIDLNKLDLSTVGGWTAISRPIGDGATQSEITNSQGSPKLRTGQPVAEEKSSNASKVDHVRLGPVFVNEAAWQSIETKSTSFPVGSVIVREKPSQSGVGTPEVLAVMIKRAPGFNPAGGDWQFLLSDGTGTHVKMSQKTGACLDCHKSQSKTDFVYPLK